MASVLSSLRPGLALLLGIIFLLIAFFIPSSPKFRSAEADDGTETDADRWYSLGASALDRGDYDRAITELSKAMNIYGRLISSTWDEFMAEVRRGLKQKRARISLPLTDSLEAVS
jgi:hypothetical protein